VTERAPSNGAVASYGDGNRCDRCRHWFWESDGGWHSLVPITYADTPELSRPSICPNCWTHQDEMEALADAASY
jgi:hypothetical protein